MTRRSHLINFGMEFYRRNEDRNDIKFNGAKYKFTELMHNSVQHPRQAARPVPAITLRAFPTSRMVHTSYQSEQLRQVARPVPGSTVSTSPTSGVVHTSFHCTSSLTSRVVCIRCHCTRIPDKPRCLYLVSLYVHPRQAAGSVSAIAYTVL